MVYDIILILIPLPIIIKTKFRGRDRGKIAMLSLLSFLGLCLFFSVGLIIIYILSCISFFATVVRLTRVTESSYFIEGDDTGTRRVAYVYWAIIEVMTAAICANMPAMSSFFRYILRTRLKKSFISRESECPGSLPQSAVKGGSYQGNHVVCHTKRQGDEKAMSAFEASEKKQHITTEDFDLSLDSHTEESSCKSHNSLSYQKSVSTPTRYASSGFLASFSRRIKSLLPFKKGKLAEADSVAEAERASRAEGGGGVIYRTDEFDVERNVV